MRPDKRGFDELRNVDFQRNFVPNAPGSVLVSFGRSQVICTATVDAKVPSFLRHKQQGWLTAEYGMLPGSTHERTEREAAKGKQAARSVEIQRLIGRSLRQAVNLQQLGERTIHLDCDVLQADGGTRAAAISGASVALFDALRKLQLVHAFKAHVAAVSVGIVDGEVCLDLEYVEDSNAATDMNVVMLQDAGFIEIQGTAEKNPFSNAELADLLQLANQGITEIFKRQRDALAAA